MLEALGDARGHLFPFAPVAVGLGVGAYFALPFEPGTGLRIGVWLAAALLLIGSLRAADLARPLVLGLALCCLGFAAAAWRVQSVAAPVLDWRRYGPVEGRIVAVDRSASDALRLTLDAVVLPGLSPARTPQRVRVSVHGDALDVDPVAGTRVMLTGHLAPPSGPTEPGGFDFGRHAWFEGLGAVGYTRSPVLALAAPEPGWRLALTRLRHRISAAIRSRLPGETGGFVAAILTGDRSGIGLDTLEDLRRSNLSHLLAISGLHMGLLTGVVFGVFRAALALVPALALRVPVRKIAALCALLAGAAYLAVSGGNVATQRAFVMAAAMLVAVMVDRRAISLRSVGLAALILLLWRPEALVSAGFQMSFAATVALVAVFAALRNRARGRPRSRDGPVWRVMKAVATAALCSLVAGLATAPIAAAQFHRVTDYGLLANILSVPLMGLLVMPAAV
ncbi:MAG: ComEC/Rec2 family competence protein, partial [Pararhodobacter sp.]|nr:ComEC/Rec2 family competence protein [Pararhodobacter sp.]